MGYLFGGHTVHEFGDGFEVAVAAAVKFYVGYDAILVLVKRNCPGASAGSFVCMLHFLEKLFAVLESIANFFAEFDVGVV